MSGCFVPLKDKKHFNQKLLLKTKTSTLAPIAAVSFFANPESSGGKKDTSE